MMRTTGRVIGGVMGTLCATPGLVGCGEESPSPGSQDCGLVIRYEAVEYAEVGFVRAAGPRVGRADVAACHDLGSDAPGAVFPEDPETVVVWRADGFDVADVLLVRETSDRYRVYANDGLPGREIELIRRTFEDQAR